ncbi:MAG: DedA family protein [Thermoleophilia bacterium]|nr:DedA family protein [Thermoleophilia bacterium]
MIDNGLIEEWLRTWGYLTIFIPLVLETAGIPLPGGTILLIAAAAASRGILNPFLVAAVASLAAIIGDNIGFCIGRYGGRRLVNRLSHIAHVEAGVVWGEHFFAIHGGKAVVLARWTAGLRIFGAWIAGMSQMRWRTFLVWNILGGVTWACTLTLVGYAFGESIERVESILGIGGAIVFAAVLVVAGVLVLRWIRGRQRARTEAIINQKFSDSRDD